MGLSFPLRRAPTIRQWLALLLAAFIVPTTIAVVAPFLHSYGRERAGIERASQDVARALMLAIDRELSSARAALLALATSPSRDAHDLRLMVVAEGVETEAEQDFLQAHGCDMAQGYLHARPIPAPESEAWMANVAARGASRGGGAGAVAC